MGRIGRAVAKLVLERPELELVAVNDLLDLENLVYLLRYDTVYGRYEKPVEAKNGMLAIGQREIRVMKVRDPAELPWRELGVGIVFECTGVHTRREDLEKHVRAGARTVLLSAPSKSRDVETVVHGVNGPSGKQQIVSCASCTTNCITPIVEIVGRRIGFTKAAMTTVHAYTSSQALVDGPNKKFRRGRAAGQNLVPASTGAAIATTHAMPEYEGRFDGIAVRAPVPVGSIADLTFVTKRKTTSDEVNRILTEESETDRYRGIVGVSKDPIVSSDVIQDPRAAVIDLELTKVIDGDLLKIMAFYDNEWGYANQMVREAAFIARTPGR